MVFIRRIRPVELGAVVGAWFQVENFATSSDYRGRVRLDVNVVVVCDVRRAVSVRDQVLHVASR